MKPQKSTSDTFYDLFEDYSLIEASFAQQYGIRLRVEDEMEWDEFIVLLAGLNGETPLGNVIRIRSEKDNKKIREFSQDERKIFNDWKSRHRRKVTGSIEDGEKAIKSLFGIK